MGRRRPKDVATGWFSRDGGAPPLLDGEVTQEPFNRTLVLGQQTVADREAAHLVELQGAAVAPVPGAASAALPGAGVVAVLIAVSFSLSVLDTVGP